MQRLKHTLRQVRIAMQSLGSASGLLFWHFLGCTQALALPTRYNVSYIPLDRDISHTHSSVIAQPELKHCKVVLY